MAYRFKLNEAVAAGASRIGLEQIDSAQARLATRENGAAAIHDARRCLKRLRALLRLVRPALPESVYRREATRLVNIGRLLADARDQHVMQQTLAKLETRFGPLPNGAGGKLTRLMANGSGVAHSGARERRQALQGLEQARTFFTRLERRAITFEHIAAGVERSYRRARRGFRDAYESPAGEAFHDWRKSVQQHWRHMQLISRAWPDVLSGRATEAKELSRLLGDDHDVEVFLAFATERGKTALSEGELEALTKLCRSLQDELRKESRPRGARLFAEPASNMRERMEFYWSAARDLSALAPPREDGEKPRKKAAAAKGPRPARREAQAASRGGTGSGPGRRSGE
jgi:CHAD domain-containing protein